MAGCARSVDDAQVDSVLALSGDAERGLELYVDLCERCHGIAGNGDGSGPELSGFDRATVLDVVLSGPVIMPSYADETDQDLADLIAYVSTL